MKLRAKPATKHQRKVFDINNPGGPEAKKELKIELKNCFSALRTEDGENLDTVETTWSNILRVYEETAESILGFTKKDKQRITSDTWMKIDERNKAKDNPLSEKSPRLTQSACNSSIYM